jgi:hypothetical protein
MKLPVRVLMVAALMFALALCNASASTLTFSTAGLFFDDANPLSSGGLGVLTFEDDALSFVPILGSPSLIVPTHVGLGMFVVTTGGPDDTDLDPLPAGAGFQLEVFVPAGSTSEADLTAVLTGSLSYSQNNIVATFPTTQFDVGGFNFRLLPNGEFDLVPETINNGLTTIQAAVTTPEPAVMSLVGVGLLALGLCRKRLQS